MSCAAATARLPRRRRSGGFSLLEVLVTVTIFALLFAVLMAGWFQALQAQARLSEAAERLQQQQQLSFALRQLMAGVMSPRDGQGLVFAGTGRGFSAESAVSLAPGLDAAPLATRLQIEGQAPALAIRIEHPAHPGQPGAAYPWKLAVAELRYQDAAGQLHERWPPEPSVVERRAPAALPTLLLLTLQFDGQSRPTTLLAAPRHSAWPLAEPRAPFETGAD